MGESRDIKMSILVADDHLIVRQGIQLIVEELFPQAQILHAATLHQILGMVQIHPIDLIILDAQFPDGVAISIIPEIKRVNSHIKILIFTSFEEEHYSLKFIEAGADGFLSKMGSEDEIRNAVSEVVSTGKHYPPLTASLLKVAKYNPNLSNPLLSLTDREVEIAILLAEGLGNLEIANLLSLKQNTISTFKKRIFQKLQIENLVELVKIVSIHHSL